MLLKTVQLKKIDATRSGLISKAFLEIGEMREQPSMVLASILSLIVSLTRRLNCRVPAVAVITVAYASTHSRASRTQCAAPTF
jgi:hypothetical protein